jgi:hypothetical protein
MVENKLTEIHDRLVKIQLAIESSSRSRWANAADVSPLCRIAFLLASGPNPVPYSWHHTSTRPHSDSLVEDEVTDPLGHLRADTIVPTQQVREVRLLNVEQPGRVVLRHAPPPDLPPDSLPNRDRRNATGPTEQVRCRN